MYIKNRFEIEIEKKYIYIYLSSQNCKMRAIAYYTAGCCTYYFYLVQLLLSLSLPLYPLYNARIANVAWL